MEVAALHRNPLDRLRTNRQANSHTGEMPIHYIPKDVRSSEGRSCFEIQSALTIPARLSLLLPIHRHRHAQCAIRAATVLCTVQLAVSTLKSLADSLPPVFSSHHHMVSA